MARKKTKKEILRATVYDKFDGHCAYCGDPLHISKMQIDHIIPKSNFQKFVQNARFTPEWLLHLTPADVNHIDNLFPSCRICNGFKDSFHLELFRGEITEQIKRANKYSRNYRMAKRYGQVQETPTEITFHFETFMKPQEKELTPELFKKIYEMGAEAQYTTFDQHSCKTDTERFERLLREDMTKTLQTKKLPLGGHAINPFGQNWDWGKWGKEQWNGNYSKEEVKKGASPRPNTTSSRETFNKCTGDKYKK